MNPILFRVFGVPISAFGVMLLIAFWVGISMTRRRAASLGIDSTMMLDIALYMIIAGIVGARIGYVLINLPVFAKNPASVLTIWRDSGLTFYGALAGAAVVAWFYARRLRILPGRLLDIATPGLALGYAVAMVGALLHGLFRGKATGVPWRVEILGEGVHPTAIYMMLAALGIYLVVRRERTSAPGVRFLTFLFLHAVSRFIVEFFVESRAVVGPLTIAQVASIVVGIGALGGLVLASARAPVLEPQETMVSEPPPA